MCRWSARISHKLLSDLLSRLRLIVTALGCPRRGGGVGRGLGWGVPLGDGVGRGVGVRVAVGVAVAVAVAVAWCRCRRELRCSSCWPLAVNVNVGSCSSCCRCSRRKRGCRCGRGSCCGRRCRRWRECSCWTRSGRWRRTRTRWRDIEIALSASRRATGAVAEVLSKEGVISLHSTCGDDVAIGPRPRPHQSDFAPHTTLARS